MLTRLKPHLANSSSALLRVSRKREWCTCSVGLALTDFGLVQRDVIGWEAVMGSFPSALIHLIRETAPIAH